MVDVEGGELFPFEWRVLDPIGFELSGELHVQYDIGLVFRGTLEVWEVSQELGRCNRPPCLRNRLLSKSVHSALGVLGLSVSVPLDLEDLDSRYRWILESRID